LVDPDWQFQIFIFNVLRETRGLVNHLSGASDQKLITGAMVLHHFKRHATGLLPAAIVVCAFFFAVYAAWCGCRAAIYIKGY